MGRGAAPSCVSISPPSSLVVWRRSRRQRPGWIGSRWPFAVLAAGRLRGCSRFTRRAAPCRARRLARMGIRRCSARSGFPARRHASGRPERASSPGRTSGRSGQGSACIAGRSPDRPSAGRRSPRCCRAAGRPHAPIRFENGGRATGALGAPYHEAAKTGPHRAAHWAAPVTRLRTTDTVEPLGRPKKFRHQQLCAYRLKMSDDGRRQPRTVRRAKP